VPGLSLVGPAPSSKMAFMGSPRVWTRRSAIAVAAGVLLAVLGAVALVRLPVVPAVVGIAVGLALAGYGLVQRPRADDSRVLSAAAGELADAVAKHEAAELRGLLADRVGTGRPQAAQVRWHTDGGLETGSLNTIAAFYQGLARRRLVILGPAGSGKTVVALRGLLDLIAALPEEPGVRVQVPVRLTRPDLAQLDALLAEHLVSTYHVRPTIARALVAHRWILPVLDGVDDLPAVPPGPFIATSRATRSAVPDATVVHLQPLTIEQVAAWLTYQFPDPTKPPGVEHRWLRVLRHLAADHSSPLATALRSPQRLSHTVAAYRDPATNPNELLISPPDGTASQAKTA
jgi:hypothetical protein